jgi:2-iminobutanoate/2-iminopropanoate deaminase
MREEIRVGSLGRPISHYTDAVRFGNLLFCSGVIAVDCDNRLVGGEDVAEQTRQALINLGEILAAAGASFADILTVTIYLTDVNDRTKINPVRKEFFGQTLPASTLIGVRELAIPGAKVEITAVAGVRTGEVESR